MMVSRKPDSYEPAKASSSAHHMAALDLWISRELRRTYNETLTEPLPSTLLQLLNGFDDKA